MTHQPSTTATTTARESADPIRDAMFARVRAGQDKRYGANPTVVATSTPVII